MLIVSESPIADSHADVHVRSGSRLKQQAVLCELVHGLPVGGTEVLVDRFVRWLDRDFRVIVACLDELGELGQRLRVDGFDVIELNRNSGIDFACMRRLARLIKDHQVDLIHAHQYTPFFYAAAARMLGPSRPIVFTEHGRFFPDLPSWKRAVFNRLMLRKSDRVIAVGEYVKQALIQNESLPADRIEVVYNGIDLTALGAERDNTRLSPDLRQQLELPPDAVIVTQVARLDPIKDHPTAVRAMSHLAREGLSIHLVIVGDGPERSRIEAEIARHGLQAQVHLLGLRRDVPDILADSDILLLTSLSEGIADAD